MLATTLNSSEVQGHKLKRSQWKSQLKVNKVTNPKDWNWLFDEEWRQYEYMFVSALEVRYTAQLNLIANPDVTSWWIDISIIFDFIERTQRIC